MSGESFNITITGDSNDSNLVLASASGQITEGSSIPGPAGPSAGRGSGRRGRAACAAFPAAERERWVRRSPRCGGRARAVRGGGRGRRGRLSSQQVR